jgi:hypothetical protein
MSPHQLSSALRSPEVHRQLLGDYQGPYSLGVGRDTDNPSAPAIVLQVEDDARLNPPSHLEIGSERVRVITRRGFVAPTPL